MSIPFMSVHIISKENTRLGEQFVHACLSPLVESQYPNEIVLVDNGSKDYIFDVYNYYKPQFEAFDCEFKLIRSELCKFNDLRNLCIEHTNPLADFFHWIDTDESYFPQDLDVLKNTVIPNEKKYKIRQIWSCFYHFMINPLQVQVTLDKVRNNLPLDKDDCRSWKDNIFAFHKGIRWKHEEGVHEHVDNLAEGLPLFSSMEYLHLGYCRAQWRTFIKWMHYDHIEHGHINAYKVENVDGQMQDYLRDCEDLHKVVYNRNPGTCLRDRQPFCVPFPNVICRNETHEHFDKLLNGCKNNDDWQTYLSKLDSDDFWLQWQQKHKELGSWKATLDWALDESLKAKWNLV